MSRVLDPLLIQTPPQTPFEAACREAMNQCDLPLPDAWQDLRQDAYIQFERLGLPSRRQEDWRYVDLRTLSGTAYRAIQDNLLTINTPGCGVWAMPLAEAWSDAELSARLTALLRPQLTQLTDPLALLALALGTQGLVIHAPKGSCVEGVIDVTLQMPLLEHGACHTVVVLLVDENAELHVRLKTRSHEGGDRLVNMLVMADVARNGRLYGLNAQAQARGTVQLDSTVFNIAEGGAVHWTTMDTPVNKIGHQTRHMLEAHLNGERSTVTANALGVLGGGSRVHYQTAVHHHVPNASSEQLIKGIVDDEALVDFGGTIFVARDAQGTNASQLNKHLMLSDNAKVFTRPQLRIDADDVKCSHGASIGQLDEEAVFYLMSRGLSPLQAREVLTDGFGADVLNQLPPSLCFVPRPHVTVH